MKTTIDNSQDVIDSRDLIERLEELTAEAELLDSAVEEAQEAVDTLKGREGRDAGGMTPDEESAHNEAIAADVEKAAEALREAKDERAEWRMDNLTELEALTKLDEEGRDYSSDWRHGETLIRRSYWVDYVEELCKDIGDLPKDIPHYIEIDWKATADNIEVDYSTVDFGGVEYLIRNS